MSYTPVRHIEVSATWIAEKDGWRTVVRWSRVRRGALIHSKELLREYLPLPMETPADDLLQEVMRRLRLPSDLRK